MSNNDDNKKKGFFSRLFGGISSVSDKKTEEEIKNVASELPSLTSLNKLKKADIVETAKNFGLDLDISLTKVKLLESWKTHFNLEDNSAEEVSAEEVKAEAPAEEETANKVEVSLDEKSPAQIISEFENKQKKSDIPTFRPGDTVSVSVKVKEGDRTRLQAFEGIVMGIKNRGLNSSFIVRKISSGIGVERTFQLHSPLIDTIQIKRKGDVRQSKLFYLRERSGKSARIKERLD